MFLAIERLEVKQAAMAASAAAFAAVAVTYATMERFFGTTLAQRQERKSDRTFIAELVTRLSTADPLCPDSYTRVARSVARAVDAKDNYTSGHCERVAEYSWRIGKELGLSAADLDRLKLAALLHDIGKL